MISNETRLTPWIRFNFVLLERFQHLQHTRRMVGQRLNDELEEITQKATME
jgi:hypothetical protein